MATTIPRPRSSFIVQIPPHRHACREERLVRFLRSLGGAGPLLELVIVVVPVRQAAYINGTSHNLFVTLITLTQSFPVSCATLSPAATLTSC